MLSFLVEKEFKQMFRNPVIPKMMVALPLMAMLVFPWAANQEIKNVRVDIVDNDHSSLSSRLSAEIAASAFFNVSGTSGTYTEALRKVDSDGADIIFNIPQDFEKCLVNGESAPLVVAANAVNGTKGTLGASHLVSMISESSVLKEYSVKGARGSGQLDRFGDSDAAGTSTGLATGSAIGSATAGLDAAAAGNIPSFSVTPQYRFNPSLDYKVFMVPALLVLLLTLVCGLLPALNIVGEKEAGTIEQINVSPVGKFQFILAKLIPLWILGFLIMVFGLIVARLVYGIVPEGSLGTLLLFASVYVLVVSGFGLIVSNYASTMQQAMFVNYFFILIFFLMGGMFTPVASMPEWAQTIAAFNPLKYFIEVMRLVYLKGSTFIDMIPQFLTLCTFAVVFSLGAVITYRKSS